LGPKKQKFLETLYKEPIFANSNINLNEKTILNYGSEKKTLESYENKEDPLQNFLEFLFFEINLENTHSLSNSLEIPLYDDTSMEQSFIYDLPFSGYKKPLPTFVLINKKVLSHIPLTHLIREFESQNFEILKLVHM
jgi:hypothetical protein